MSFSPQRYFTKSTVKCPVEGCGAIEEGNVTLICEVFTFILNYTIYWTIPFYNGINTATLILLLKPVLKINLAYLVTHYSFPCLS